MRLTEQQLANLIKEATKRVVMEYAYHEKQHKPSDEEHAAWVAKVSASKKKQMDAERRKAKKSGKEDDGAVDYYDYKHGKSNFKPVMFGDEKVIKETRLDYDMDNFSGRWNRGQRYDIIVDGYVEYHDIPEEAIDRCCYEVERKYGEWGEEPKIEVVEI